MRLRKTRVLRAGRPVEEIRHTGVADGSERSKKRKRSDRRKRRKRRKRLAKCIEKSAYVKLRIHRIWGAQ